MQKVILIKYGELTTKKGNRKQFINQLVGNIKAKLKGIDYKLDVQMDRLFIYADEFDLVLNKIKNVFGIHAIVLAEKTETDFESIKKLVLNLVKEKDFETFKVETKRNYKQFEMTSMELSRILGGEILKNKENIKVDVKNPELLVKVEVRKDNTYVYFDEIKGQRGYPLGIQKKGLLLLSGGIDSPVAGYLAMKTGIDIDCIYFESPPHTSVEALHKVETLAKMLNDYSGRVKLLVVPFTKLQEAIYKDVPSNYMITIMRRMMYRIAEKVSLEKDYKAIINGESIGQVASQTLTSIGTITELVKLSIIRPVSCLDKLDIIKIAKEIGTYETSILPFEDCCTIFLPKNPVINPKSLLCQKYETNFNYEELIEEAVSNIKYIDLNSDEFKKFF